MDAFIRVENLIGEKNLEKLKNSSVAVFGVGGVGGFICEALVRSGIGEIAVFDGDTVDKSNLNRQIIATVDTIGKDKVEVVKSRLLSINPNLKISANKIFYLPENADQVDLSKYDYIVDAVDTVSAKIQLIERAKEKNIPVISCMGTGGKMQIERLKVCDISLTNGCPLARVMRRELKKRNIFDVKVVYSDEGVNLGQNQQDDFVQKEKGKKIAPPSMIFVPAVAGLYIAREVVTDLISKKEG
ncbi:MAG: tRNA threonylcarbamoyladenosine dehydratase [Clostridiales bacterium]|nr:tRNA threonylcarbamoyladenosine dehydratase [Clostridiales bacterium]